MNKQQSGLVLVERFAAVRKPFQDKVLNELFDSANSLFERFTDSVNLEVSPELKKAVNLTATDISYVVSLPKSDLKSSILNKVFVSDVEKGIKFVEVAGGKKEEHVEGETITDAEGRQYVFKKEGGEKGRWHRTGDEKEKKEDIGAKEEEKKIKKELKYKEDKDKRESKEKIAKVKGSKDESEMAGVEELIRPTQVLRGLERKWYMDEEGDMTRSVAPTDKFKNEVDNEALEVQEKVKSLLPFEVLFGEHPDVEDAIVKAGKIDQTELKAIHAIRDHLLAGVDEEEGGISSKITSGEFDPKKPSSIVDWLLTQTQDATKFGVDFIFDKLYGAVEETYNDPEHEHFKGYVDSLIEGYTNLMEKYIKSLTDPSVADLIQESLYRYNVKDTEEYFSKFENLLGGASFGSKILGEHDEILTDDELGLLTLSAFIGMYKPKEFKPYAVWQRGVTKKLGNEKNDLLGQFYHSDKEGFTYAFKASRSEEGVNAVDVFDKSFDGSLYAFMAHYDLLSADSRDAVTSDYEDKLQELLVHSTEMYFKDKGIKEPTVEQAKEVYEKILNRAKKAVSSAKNIAEDFNGNKGWYALNDLFDGELTSEELFKDKYSELVENEKVSENKKKRILKAKEKTNPVRQSKKVKKPVINRDYINRIFNWMLEVKRGILSVDKELDKAEIGIKFVDNLILKKNTNRGIFFLSKDCINYWKDEVNRVRPESKIVLISPDAENKESVINRIQKGKLEADFVFCVNDVLEGEVSVVETLKNLEGVVLIDEFHLGDYKKRGSVVSEAIDTICNSPDVIREYVFGITVATVPSSPEDLFNLIELVNPDSLGGNIDKFNSKFGSISYNHERGVWDFPGQFDLVGLKGVVDPYVFTLSKKDPVYVDEMKDRRQLPETVLNPKYSGAKKIDDSYRLDFTVYEILEHLMNSSNYHVESSSFHPIVVFAKQPSLFKDLKSKLSRELGVNKNTIDTFVSVIDEETDKNKLMFIQDNINSGISNIICVTDKDNLPNSRLMTNHIIYLDRMPTKKSYEKFVDNLKKKSVYKPNSPITITKFGKDRKYKKVVKSFNVDTEKDRSHLDFNVNPAWVDRLKEFISGSEDYRWGITTKVLDDNIDSSDLESVIYHGATAYVLDAIAEGDVHNFEGIKKEVSSFIKSQKKKLKYLSSEELKEYKNLLINAIFRNIIDEGILYVGGSK